MPIVDMNLNELNTYMGSSPRPDDFDEYWDRAIDELHAIDPDILIEEETSMNIPFATCYHLWFTGTGGARIHAKLVKPKSTSDDTTNNYKKPAVLKFHGYTMSSGDWTNLLPYAASGMIAAALDCRGQGGLSQDIGGVKGGTLYGFIIKGVESGPDALYFRHVFLDTKRLAEIIFDMDDVDTNKVYAGGASQGGALTLAVAALEPRIKKAASVYPFLSDFKRVWDQDFDVEAYSGLREYFRKFDPLHEKEDEFFNTLSYIDIQNLAPRIKSDVLLFTGLMDDICPPSTQFAVYNKISASKNILIYPDFKHEHLPGHQDKELSYFLD